MSIKRKEVYLDTKVIERLQKQADKKDWSLKKFMENVLINQSKK
jgi:hypothetical protein